METTSTNQERHCEDCGRGLRGRSDKRFCNDGCRNNFNRQKKRQMQLRASDTVKDILRSIKENYHILRALEPPYEDAEIGIPLEDVAIRDLNLVFFTSIANDGDHLWKCVFDIGWRIDGRDLIVKVFPEKAYVDPDGYLQHYVSHMDRHP